MSNREIDSEYVAEVIDRLTSNPTAQELDYLVAAHTQIGYYAAILTSDADLAKAEREFQEADAFRKRKEADPKAAATTLEAYATIDSMPYRRAEIKAFGNAKKLTNLWDSIRQTIDAIKFIGKMEGPIGFGG